ncbi:MAG: ComEC/Rec2 family competence protein [Candidatus Roizmanbacteria bacterium]
MPSWWTPHIFDSIYNGLLPEPHASLIKGIVFGIPLSKSSYLYQQLQIVGLLHIVVLSGMNISILLQITQTILGRLSKIYVNMLSILILIIFISFVGIQAPILRAGIMGLLTLVSLLTGKKRTTLLLLLVSAVISLCIWPEWISSISFQLSYAATVGIVLFGQTQKSQEVGQSILSNFFNYIKQELRITMSAQIFTIPLIAYHFRQLSIISPIANIVISWTITPIMILGLLLPIINELKLLSIPTSYILYILLQFLILTVNILSSIPFANISW